MVKIYRTSRNGGKHRMIIVYKEKKELYVYVETSINSDDESNFKMEYHSTFTRILVGIDNSRGKTKHHGQDILIETRPSTYVFIGTHGIYKWKLLDDKIVRFYCPTSNSAVSYPYAIGKKRAYSMTEAIAMPLPTKKTSDPFKAYYDWQFGHGSRPDYISIKMKVIRK